MIFNQDIKLLFAILAILVSLVGGFGPYLRDIFRKKTKPHAYTWLIWTITQGTAAVGLWQGEGGWAFIALCVGAISCFLIFVLSLRYGTRNITRGDTAILIFTLLAIMVWWQLHYPLLAIIMVSVIDVAGYLPSYRKTFEEPWTETALSWVIFIVANVLTLLALNEYNFMTLAYLVSITVANIALLVICLVRRRVIPQDTD